MPTLIRRIVRRFPMRAPRLRRRLPATQPLWTPSRRLVVPTLNMAAGDPVIGPSGNPMILPNGLPLLSDGSPDPCGCCGPSEGYIEARLCIDDSPINIWATQAEADAHRTWRASGLCAYFPAVSPSEIPPTANYFADLGTVEDLPNCDYCTPCDDSGFTSFNYNHGGFDILVSGVESCGCQIEDPSIGPDAFQVYDISAVNGMHHAPPGSHSYAASGDYYANGPGSTGICDDAYKSAEYDELYVTISISFSGGFIHAVDFFAQLYNAAGGPGQFPTVAKFHWECVDGHLPLNATNQCAACSFNNFEDIDSDGDLEPVAGCAGVGGTATLILP